MQLKTLSLGHSPFRGERACILQIILRAVLAVALTTGKASHAGEVKQEMPD